MQFGPSLDKSKTIGLVEGTTWNGYLELNRLVFTDRLPRNSESRALGVVFRLMRKHRPDIGWVVSFADATQCGDGTIYRASGFVLTDCRPSYNIARLPIVGVVHKLSLQSRPTAPLAWLGGRTYLDVTDSVMDWSTFVERVGGEILPGFQLRYVYFLDQSLRARLTVPVLPFNEIDKRGARMYRA